MASNNVRAKASKRVWGCIREVCEQDEEITMSNDSLGHRYQVNKFGIRVEHESVGRLVAISDGAYALLRLQGWEPGEGKMRVLISPAGARVVFDEVTEHLDAAILRISVH